MAHILTGLPIGMSASGQNHRVAKFIFACFQLFSQRSIISLRASKIGAWVAESCIPYYITYHLH